MGFRASSLEIYNHARQVSFRCCASSDETCAPALHISIERHGQGSTHLLLGVGPAGDLDNHVQDGLLLIGIERNVVEGRDRDAILLDEDAVVKGVGSADVAGGVLRSHCGG